MSERSLRPRTARSAAVARAGGPGSGVRTQPPNPIFRKLGPTDQGRLAAHLLRLDASDRQMRFGGSLGDRSIRAYCERIDWPRATILGCFVQGELRGVAELVLTGADFPGKAELALTVEKPFQNRGIGTELLRRILVIARNRYLTTVYMICLLENQEMRHMARKFAARLVIREGQVEGKIWPPWPTYLSFFEEAASDGQALFRATFETAVPDIAHSRPWKGAA